jgi:hypothetical protein
LADAERPPSKMRLLSRLNSLDPAMHAPKLTHFLKLHDIAPERGRRCTGFLHKFAHADDATLSHLCQDYLPSFPLVHDWNNARPLMIVNDHSLILHRETSLQCDIDRL